MSFNVQFLGASGTVTGSCYLVTTDTSKFLIDCGMYQGPDVEARNLDDFDFDPSTIDFVLLTHAHLDHIGLLPKLVRHGFAGKIYATMHSVQIGTIILLDAAKIQENNFTQGRPWQFAGKVEMIYDTKDAEQTLTMFNSVNLNETFSPVDGVEVKYVHAGHILGAASLEIKINGEVIVFSGDIGRTEHVLIGGFDPTHQLDAKYIVMESLYGGEYHPKRKESVAEMMQIVQKTLSRGGSVFIPTFAVQRTQELLNDFKIAKESGALGKDVPVWLDSPMAQEVTRIYGSALDHTEDSLFNFPNLGYVKHARQSARISKRPGQIILAGSGMANGGRILQHLAHNLGNKKNSVIFVGYQAEATLGRSLVEGAKSIQIDGLNVEVGAEIHYLHGFSAHGDTNDYKAWIGRYYNDGLSKVFLVHSEPERAKAMKDIFESEGKDHPYIPSWKETITLD